MKQMRKSVWPITAMILFSALAFRCADDLPANQPVHFTFHIDMDESTASDLRDDVVLIVSAETPMGEPVFASQMLSVRKHSAGLITEPVKTKSTDIVLTGCVLATADGEILYAVPSAQSPLGKTAPMVLGQQITIMNGNEGALVLLPVMNYQARDFGLRSFRHETSFTILVTKAGSNRAIAATAWIMEGTDTILRYALQPKVNKINFNGTAGTTYTLLVAKAAFKTFRQTFTTASISRSSLRINLEPALTITARGISDTSFPPLSFYIGGTTGTLSVDWGDATFETKQLTPYETEFSHYYSAAGNYPVVISGDLNRVTSFYSFYGDGEFSDIHFDQLINLSEIRYGLTPCPAVIDLSHNSKLAFAMLPSLLDLEQLYLPQHHQLSYFDIDGANRLNTQDIDAIIDNIYANSVRENITGGIFSLALYWAQDDGDTSMVGPPSAAALKKLDLLRDNYGWQIRPGNAPMTMRFSTERERMRQRIRLPDSRTVGVNP